MNKNTNTSKVSFVALIQGRDTFAPELRNTQLARTIAAGYSVDYCDEVPETTLGACGCVDYHMADCPTRTGSHDYYAEAERDEWEHFYYDRY